MPNTVSPRDQVLRPLLRYLGDWSAEQQVPSWTADEWRTVVEESRQHELEPLLFARLRKAPSSAPVPPDVVRVLEHHYCVNSLRNRRTLLELGAILRAFHAGGVDVIVLKGAYLLDALYRDPGARVLSDVDLLVRRDSLPAARRILIEMGYKSLLQDSIDVRCSWHHHLPPFLREASTPVEIHWTIVKPSAAIVLDLDDLWRHSAAAVIGGAPARTLSHTDSLLHLCLHAAHDHHWIVRAESEMPLRPVLDIALYARQFGAVVDWQRLVETANTVGAGRFVYCALSVAHRLTDAPVRSLTWQGLHRSESDEAIVDLVCEFLLTRSPVQLPGSYRRLLNSRTVAERWQALRDAVFPSPSRLRAVDRDVVDLPTAYWKRLFRVARALTRDSWTLPLTRGGRIATTQLVRRSRIAEWRRADP